MDGALLIVLDSTFLVDLERERRRRVQGPCHDFLATRASVPLAVTFTIVGELAAGRTLGRDRAAWEDFLSPFRLLEWSRDVAWQFGASFRDLQVRGQMIGANDLWIAATAICHQAPVATRNRDEFSRVSGLTVWGY